MNGTATRFTRFGAGLLGLVTLGWILTGQAKPGEQEMPYHQGVPTDWSHNQVIFSAPATEEQARELSQDPRYWQQLYRRGLSRTLNNDPANGISDELAATTKSARRGGLWSEDLGDNSAPGAQNYPAKYSFNLTTANCGNTTTPDYVVYSTGLTGSGTQASVVAYDNLYTGCSGTVPSVYWAYNTGGLILTSPVISLDGTQVAFVQTNSALTASLILLKWKSSTTETVALPGVPTSVSTTAYRTCAAPCMTEIFLADGNGVEFDDRNSSLFYNFSADIGWVGGSTGWLVQLTGLFKGTPAEVTTGGFPAHLNPAHPSVLSNPVYDQRSKNVFVGDGGGYFYKVASSNGAVTQSAELDFGAGLVQGPVLDQSNGLIYVFASSDGTANCTGGTACAAIYSLTTNFASGASGSKTTVGQSVVNGSATNPNPLYLGGFDSAYYNSTGGTGNLYVCGNTGADPNIYRVPVTTGTLGTSIAIAPLTPAADTPSCSAVTDFPNPNASPSKMELIFFSVQKFGRPCANKGCLMSFVSTPWQPKTTYKLGQEIMILDTSNSHLYIETAASTGTSGATAPAWTTSAGVKVTDGTVTWVNQGGPTVTALGAWKASTTYPLQSLINDGTNVEIVIVRGTSGTSPPTWNPTPGGLTYDPNPTTGVTWINAGPWPNDALSLTGGTGGVIIDNTSTFSGASQVYFFTLGNQACTTSGGTGGCAMQASQSALQ
jgi:hypothetical protein